MPGYKSLLDIDRLLEAWESPDTAAPQRMTHLRHVADLAAAGPADREGAENAIPVVVEEKTRRPSATGDGREAGSAEIPPPPDYGAKDVTVDGIRGLLASDGRNRQSDNATLRAWAELARQDPKRAQQMLDQARDAPVGTPGGGVSMPLPPRDDHRTRQLTPEEAAGIQESLMTGKDWAAEARGAATAKILPDGKLTVAVDAVTPRQGPTLPPGSVRVSGEDMTPDEMLATLHKIAPHIGEYTDDERKAATEWPTVLSVSELDEGYFGQISRRDAEFPR